MGIVKLTRPSCSSGFSLTPYITLFENFSERTPVTVTYATAFRFSRTGMVARPNT